MNASDKKSPNYGGSSGRSSRSWGSPPPRNPSAARCCARLRPKRTRKGRRHKAAEGDGGDGQREPGGVGLVIVSSYAFRRTRVQEDTYDYKGDGMGS